MEKIQDRKELEKRVKRAIGLLFFIGGATIVAGLLAIWIPIVKALIDPSIIVMGVLFFVFAYFTRKGSMTALLAATTAFVLDAFSILLLPLLGMTIPPSFVSYFVVKFIFIYLLVQGTLAMRHLDKGKPSLAKGIGIGTALFVALFILILMMPSDQYASSSVECSFYKGEDYDLCIFTVVQNTREGSLCKKISDDGLNEFCTAIINQDSGFCESRGGDYDIYNYCLAMTSQEMAETYCNRIIDQNVRKECLDLS